MLIKFHTSFDKDLDKILQPHVKQAIQKMMERAELAKNLNEIPNCKRLTAYKNAYRILIGDFRIGLFLDDNVIRFARVAPKRDIYRIFP